MSLSDVVALFAEIALGLAGFARVASAFAGRTREFRPIERSRIGGVLLNAGSVLAGSLVFLASEASGTSISIALGLGAATSFPLTLLVAIHVLPPVWRRLGEPESTTELWVILVTTIQTVVHLGLYAATFALDTGPPTLMAAFTSQILLGLWMFARLPTREN